MFMVYGEPFFGIHECLCFAGQAISGGKAVIDVSYFGIHVHQENHDLCEETPCPIEVGDFILSHNQVLPGFTPPVSFTSVRCVLFLKLISG